jgi:hypothetical protein
MIQGCYNKLASTKYVREMLANPADLSEFRERPTPRLVCGLILMGLSYLMGWPAVAAFSMLAVWLREPWIAIIGCPATYGLSCVVFLIGAWLAQAPHYMAVLSRYALWLIIRTIFRRQPT